MSIGQRFIIYSQKMNSLLVNWHMLILKKKFLIFLIIKYNKSVNKIKNDMSRDNVYY